jgi:hypothetical protein
LQQESTFFKSKLWKNAGSNFNHNYKLAADFELWVRFFKYSDIKCINKLLGGFRVHSNQKSSLHYDKYLDEVKEIISNEKKHFDHEGSKIDNKKKKLKQNTSISFIATSLAPKNHNIQKQAIDSWISNGYTVISFNNSIEIGKLSPIYRDVVFQEVTRTATEETGKPLVYIDDIISHFASLQKSFTLINSDIIFSFQNGISDELDALTKSDKPCITIASRIEVENDQIQFKDELHFNVLRYGRHYYCGYDFFFFNSQAVMCINEALRLNSHEKFALGIPWWDYYIPMLALQNGIKCFYLYPSPIYHHWHEAVYSKDLWIRYGLVLCKSVFSNLNLMHPIFDKDFTNHTNLDTYLLELCSQITRLLSNNLSRSPFSKLLSSGFCSDILIDGIESEMLNFRNIDYRYIGREYQMQLDLSISHQINSNILEYIKPLNYKK